VTVTVKVRDHHALIAAAPKASKMVLSECLPRSNDPVAVDLPSGVGVGS
jgi:hypothetical protein